MTGHVGKGEGRIEGQTWAPGKWGCFANQRINIL